MEFLKVDSVDGAREKLLSSVKNWMARRKTLPLAEACGRIIAEDVFAPFDIPDFRRSTVDGYAVLSGDTAAAGESIPVFLTMKVRVEMGESASFTIGRGECAEVSTGGMLPDGADAVAMVEYAEFFGGFGSDGVGLYGSVANGENVVQIGEDAKAGELLLRRGKRLLPQDIGALAAAGVTAVPVYTPPRLTILSTGDELVPPEKEPRPGQVRDINTYALTALAQKNGFSVAGAAVLPDDEGALERALRDAMEAGDIVAVSGGSSQGKKDITRTVIDRVSSPGVYTHGMAVKPGKPTILGYDAPSRTLLAGLPGHPVSAMMVFELLFCWLLREITGSAQAFPIPARLSCNVASSPGKLTCWPVRLEWAGGENSAEPIFGKSGLITTLTRADGYFTVDRGTEGLRAGETVLVHLF
ncbi:MAG: molybdopterin-binding protein [Synergistaceae bacterium]|nr:molybdopterin-binding protein [Synergistaceae bacterium]